MSLASISIALLAFAPMALAQGATNSTNNTTSDPSLNESDFDNSTPPADDSYLNDTNSSSSGSSSSDPTLNESELDTSVPTADDSYLGATPTPAGEAIAGKATPALGGALIALGIVAAALATRRS